jgi:hypothetical protein
MARYGDSRAVRRAKSINPRIPSLDDTYESPCDEGEAALSKWIKSVGETATVTGCVSSGL